MPKFRRPLFAMAALSLLAFAALGAAACGGDDDDSGSNGATNSGADATTTTTTTSSNDKASDAGGAKPSGTDEKYVAALCKSAAEFLDSFSKLQASAATATSEDDILKAFTKPMEEWIKDMKDAKPPSDLKDYHEKTVAAMEKALNGMKSGDPNALSNFDIGDPPKGAAERLQAAADKNKDCQDAQINFEG